MERDDRIRHRHSVASAFVVGGRRFLTGIPILLLGAALHACASDPGPEPHPNLSPADVVRIQVEALRQNDHPSSDAGIAVAFRFASPANRRATGPVERFSRIVHSPAYRPMIGHRDASFGELIVVGNHASQEVSVTTRQGRRVEYRFVLSLQTEGTHFGCWMTDAVLPSAPPERREGIEV